MQEDVGSAIIGDDEPIPFTRVKPLHAPADGFTAAVIKFSHSLVPFATGIGQDTGSLLRWRTMKRACSKTQETNLQIYTMSPN